MSKQQTAISLRDQLIGAWKLVSYVEEPVDGSAPSYPFGEDAKGIIMYTPDGFMSAQLSVRERVPFASDDWYQGKPEEFAAAASSYFAYTGPFQVDEEAQTLTHSMFISLFPNWIGQTQPRVAHIDRDILTITTDKPVESRGKIVNPQLRWKRAIKGMAER
jgi:Lipocalin-like domain